jgi:hypothetical protein
MDVKSSVSDVHPEMSDGTLYSECSNLGSLSCAIVAGKPCCVAAKRRQNKAQGVSRG